MDELYGCFKYIGMSWDMIMRLPIQERRMMIRRYNMDADAIEKNSEGAHGADTRRFEGELINDYARLEQNNQKGGR